MMKLWILLKTVRFGVWFLCISIIYVGVRYINFLNTPKNENKIESREAQRYDNLYNKPHPNDKIPIYDYSAWGLVKRDGRYFLIPKEYAGVSGFSFFWPSKIPHSLYKQGDEADRDKALIQVFMESGYSSIGTEVKSLGITDKNICHQNYYTAFYWNNILIFMIFAKKTHEQDWALICAETLRILSLVKEVKNHD